MFNLKYTLAHTGILTVTFIVALTLNGFVGFPGVWFFLVTWALMTFLVAFPQIVIWASSRTKKISR